MILTSEDAARGTRSTVGISATCFTRRAEPRLGLGTAELTRAAVAGLVGTAFAGQAEPFGRIVARVAALGAIGCANAVFTPGTAVAVGVAATFTAEGAKARLDFRTAELSTAAVIGDARAALAGQTEPLSRVIADFAAL